MQPISRFGVSMPQELLEAFDERIARQGYRTRSEAIRDVVRDYLVEAQWASTGEEVVGTVTIVYDHEMRELTHALTELQHQYHDAIACSTHVHLDEHNCLEVIVVAGRSEQVRTIAERLVATKGVKHGKLVCTTRGTGLA